MANRSKNNRGKRKNLRNNRKMKIDQESISKEVWVGVIASGILFLAGAVIFLLIRRGAESEEGVQAEEVASFVPIWISFLPFIFIRQRKKPLTKREQNLIRILAGFLVLTLIAGIVVFMGFEMR